MIEKAQIFSSLRSLNFIFLKIKNRLCSHNRSVLISSLALYEAVCPADFSLSFLAALFPEGHTL